MSPETRTTLRPRLTAAQKALEAALEEACDIDVGGADIPELLRLEEQLTAARDSASDVIEALRRLGSATPQDSSESPETHRVFVDDKGVQWDAFVVRPSHTKGRTLPPPYDQGWLAIQCPEGVRRVTPIPEGWRECSSEEFCKLLETTPVAPRRTS